MEEEKRFKSPASDQTGNRTPEHIKSFKWNTRRDSQWILIRKDYIKDVLERIDFHLWLEAGIMIIRSEFQGAAGIYIERASRQVSAQEHSCSISFINLVARCKMHMLTYRLVAGDFQKLEPNATHVRCYSYTAYPLKNGRSREKYFMGCTKR